ncbi:hypothetical protein L914_06759 [Phytophthora nicotianae]|uniref:Uncharacterized protein n=1 Tax=Phytophthora nicotianae TaxID=4792 RepID=W2NJQ2_PHYNI|nr:hypothetical protein L914_06759 [Phytophthora nicotianae]
MGTCADPTCARFSHDVLYTSAQSFQKRKELVQKWNSASCDITPHALKEFEKEKELVAHQTVQGDESLFYVLMPSIAAV